MITATYLARIVVDISHWQDNVDFKQVKDSGMEAVILKATQGLGYTDPTFVDRSNEAAAAGLLVGAYHFLECGSPDDIIDQMNRFLEITDGRTTMLALDVEACGEDTPTIEQAATAAHTLERESGQKPLIYMGRYGPDGAATGLPNAYLASCPLWLSAYSLNSQCPPGWSKWTLWQFTDGDAGLVVPPVPGVGACDQSFFAGTLTEFRGFWLGVDV